MSTLALCGATVVLGLDPVELASADVVISGDRIAAVGPAPPGVPRRDCVGTLVLPGNVCAHTHLYSALVQGNALSAGAARELPADPAARLVAAGPGP